MPQLSNLERRTARGGRDSIDHPPKSHDDVANACAGAVHLVLGRHKGPNPSDLYGPTADEDYDSDEEAEVAKRLQDLGYLG